MGFSNFIPSIHLLPILHQRDICSNHIIVHNFDKVFPPMKFSMAIFQYECRMLAVVLWKSWRIRKHRKWQTLIEICAPVLLVLLLVSVKAVMEPDSDVVDNYKPTIFPTQNMKVCKSNLYLFQYIK